MALVTTNWKLMSDQLSEKGWKGLRKMDGVILGLSLRETAPLRAIADCLRWMSPLQRFLALQKVREFARESLNKKRGTSDRKSTEDLLGRIWIGPTIEEGSFELKTIALAMWRFSANKYPGLNGAQRELVEILAQWMYENPRRKQ